MQAVLEGEDVGDGVEHTRLRHGLLGLARRIARRPVYLNHRQRQRGSAHLHVDGHLLRTLGVSCDGALDRREAHPLDHQVVLRRRLRKKYFVVAPFIGGRRPGHAGGLCSGDHLRIRYRFAGHVGDAPGQDIGGKLLGRRDGRAGAEGDGNENQEEKCLGPHSYGGILNYPTLHTLVQHPTGVRSAATLWTVEYLQRRPA